MAHHAYLVVGDGEAANARAMGFIARAFALPAGHPDITELSYTFFSVDDARDVGAIALRAPTHGDTKALVLTTPRFSHQAQNALLKLFEEPPKGTHLFLIVPHAGMILPTLRSRLVELGADETSAHRTDDLTTLFVEGSADERKKIVARILDHAGRDKDEDKQAARREAEMLAAGLMRVVHKRPAVSSDDTAGRLFLSDLSRFLPILVTPSAPLKPILEHILLTFPILPKRPQNG